MRKTTLLLTCCMFLASSAQADVVYLKNGRKYEGAVTRREGKVIVKMAMGTLTFSQDQVVHIEKKALPSPPKTPTQPARTQGGSSSVLPVGGRTFSIERAMLPEPVIFLFMRNLKSMPAGTAAFELSESIKRWRALAHDGKRNVGVNQWLAPTEFIRRQETFESLAGEALKLYRDATSRRPKNRREKAERNRKIATSNVKLQQAARTIADPLLRTFMVGVAAYEAKNFSLAEAQFRKCVRLAPRIAAFHQGRALAMTQLKRELDSLEAFSTVLTLQPDTVEAVRLAREAIKKVPGAYMQRPSFQKLTRQLSQYTDSSSRRAYSTTKTTWLLPGKVVRTRDHELPRLPYHRLVFRQAVGVPVGPSSLLVDAEAVANALEVFIRVDDGTLVRGDVRRSRYYGRGKKKPPVVIVNVADYTFTPVKVGGKDEDAPTFEKGQTVVTCGLGLFEEMGRGVRKIPGTITEVGKDGMLAVSMRLAAGEAASPLVTPDGVLAGFLAGKTDAQSDDGGDDSFIPLSVIEGVVKRSSAKYRPSGGYGRVKRTVEPLQASGQFFVVYATCAEKFDK